MNSPRSSRPVFVADTCIGGLSVLKSLWSSGNAGEAIFMADYAVNPLGVKSDCEIARVVDIWLRRAEQQADSLVIACNTLSIRYHQLARSGRRSPGLKNIVTMVDGFQALVNAEAARLDGKRVLIIGTEFTAGQPLYPQIFAASLPNPRVRSVGATELEQKIARFELNENGVGPALTPALEQAIADTDVAVLACTCFPMVRTELETRFPRVLFLDPGAYCSGSLEKDAPALKRRLSINVTGEVVAKERVVEFARSYLGAAAIG